MSRAEQRTTGSTEDFMRHPGLKFLNGGLIAAAMAAGRGSIPRADAAAADLGQLCATGGHREVREEISRHRCRGDVLQQRGDGRQAARHRRRRLRSRPAEPRPDLRRAAANTTSTSRWTCRRSTPISSSRSCSTGVKANTTIDGKVYAVPHQWGTSGLMVDKTKAPGRQGLGRSVRPQVQGPHLDAPEADDPARHGLRRWAWTPSRSMPTRPSTRTCSTRSPRS